MKTRLIPSGLPGTHPVSLFVEREAANLTPRDSRVLEPKDSIPVQTPESVSLSESSQIDSTAISGQTENPLILYALPSSEMKSPCTGTPSLYQTRETEQQKNDWLDAIARDDRRDNRA
jgi:hypothetical protein